MENNLLQMTVTIAGRPFPLKVSMSEEESVRIVVKIINDKINQFQINYPKKDKQDCLSMALLTFAVDLYRLQQQQQQVSFVSPLAVASSATLPAAELSEQLHAIEVLLDQMLRS